MQNIGNHLIFKVNFYMNELLWTFVIDFFLAYLPYMHGDILFFVFFLFLITPDIVVKKLANINGQFFCANCTIVSLKHKA